MTIKARTVTQEQLYGQVWAKPMRRLAAEYGVSDVALAKVCRKPRVPKPGIGYWNCVQHGLTPRGDVEPLNHPEQIAKAVLGPS